MICGNSHRQGEKSKKKKEKGGGAVTSYSNH